MKRTQIYFTEEEHKFLKKEAYENDISMAEVIRLFIDEQIKKKNDKKS
jgi:hypothetical protein